MNDNCCFDVSRLAGGQNQSAEDLERPGGPGVYDCQQQGQQRPDSWSMMIAETLVWADNPTSFSTLGREISGGSGDEALAAVRDVPISSCSTK